MPVKNTTPDGSQRICRGANLTIPSTDELLIYFDPEPTSEVIDVVDTAESTRKPRKKNLDPQRDSDADDTYTQSAAPTQKHRRQEVNV